MTGPARVQPGVPSGGQFATQPRTAATDIQLVDPPKVILDDPKYADLVARQRAAFNASETARKRGNDATLAMVGAYTRDRFPGAKTFEVHWRRHDETIEVPWSVPIRDADGEIVGDRESEDWDEVNRQMRKIVETGDFYPIDFPSDGVSTFDIDELNGIEAAHVQAEADAKRSRLDLDASGMRARYNAIPTIAGMTDDEVAQVGRDALQSWRTFDGLDRAVSDEIAAYWEAK